MSENAPSHFYVIGLGRLGGSVARILAKSGRLAGAATRNSSKASIFERELDVTVDLLSSGVTSSLEPGVCVLICVPDRFIEPVFVAASQNSAAQQIWLHVSGSQGLAPFHAAQPGTSVGFAHPLYSFSVDDTHPDDLADSVLAVCGDERALHAARSLASLLRCQPVELTPEMSVPYHLAAVLVSNGTYALLSAASDVLEAAGASDPLLSHGLAQLASQSAQNAAELGAVDAATGPAVRGDASTIRGHREWLRESDVGIDTLYVELSRVLARIADKRGVSPALLGGLEQVLNEPQ